MNRCGNGDFQPKWPCFSWYDGNSCRWILFPAKKACKAPSFRRAQRHGIAGATNVTPKAKFLTITVISAALSIIVCSVGFLSKHPYIIPCRCLLVRLFGCYIYYDTCLVDKKSDDLSKLFLDDFLKTTCRLSSKMNVSHLLQLEHEFLYITYTILDLQT